MQGDSASLNCQSVKIKDTEEYITVKRTLSVNHMYVLCGVYVCVHIGLCVYRFMCVCVCI